MCGHGQDATSQMDSYDTASQQSRTGQASLQARTGILNRTIFEGKDELQRGGIYMRSGIAISKGRRNSNRLNRPGAFDRFFAQPFKCGKDFRAVEQLVAPLLIEPDYRVRKIL